MTKAESQTLIILGIKGREIKTHDQIMSEVYAIIKNSSLYRLSKKSGVNLNTLRKIKNGDAGDLKTSTLLKILQTGRKRMIIVDEI